MAAEVDYTLNPTLMTGTVKSIADGQVTLNLRGRLGLITVPETVIVTSEKLQPQMTLTFYFSYLQVVTTDLDYDSTELRQAKTAVPCLLGGQVIHVDDTAVRVAIMDGLGTIYVPRRWVFTPVTITTGLKVEFYLSAMVSQQDSQIA